MKAIVTVKLPKNPDHDPKNKRIGICPVSSKLCTDVTGEHHSYIEEGNDLVDIEKKAARKYGHVTRLEAI